MIPETLLNPFTKSHQRRVSAFYWLNLSGKVLCLFAVMLFSKTKQTKQGRERKKGNVTLLELDLQTILNLLKRKKLLKTKRKH